MEEKEYSVSEAVRLIGVEPHVLRYWEEELQIKIRRTSQGHRVYSQENLDTFCRVKKLKEKGLQLKAIRILLDEPELSACPGERDQEILHDLRKLEGSFRENESQEIMGPETGKQEDFSRENESRKSVDREIGSREDEITDIEIVRVEKKQDYLDAFEEILRKLITEVIAEENKNLEKSITAGIREELEDYYLQFCQITEEASAEKETLRKQSRIRQMLRRIFSGHP